MNCAVTQSAVAQDDAQLDDDLAERLGTQADQIAERSVATDELSRLIWDHEEFAALDLLLDALRYGGDVRAAWDGLRACLHQSVAAHVYRQLVEAEVKRSRGERAADVYYDARDAREGL